MVLSEEFGMRLKDEPRDVVGLLSAAMAAWRGVEFDFIASATLVLSPGVTFADA